MKPFLVTQKKSGNVSLLYILMALNISSNASLIEPWTIHAKIIVSLTTFANYPKIAYTWSICLYDRDGGGNIKKQTIKALN